MGSESGTWRDQRLKKLSFLAACAAVWIAAPATAQVRLGPAYPLGQHWAAWTPGAPAGSGSFLAVTYMYDDGGSENALGATCNTPTCNPADAMLVWAQYFDTLDPASGNATANTITRIDVAFGTPPGPSAPAPGTAFEVYVYDDPSDDSDPLDLSAASLVAQVSATSASPDSDTFESVMLPPT